MIEFVDVSGYQGPSIDWGRVAASGIAAAYAKASEGVTVTDEDFVANCTRARAAGLRVGGYHFLSPTSSPAAQAAHVLEQLRLAAWTPEDLPPAIDVESKRAGESDDEVARATCTVAHLLEGALGVAPVIYTYRNFAAVLEHASELARYPLWLAAYWLEEPAAPAPWTSWWAWQYADRAIVPGVPTPCDVSRAIALP